jgi:alpha-L-rhamnosidase
MEDFRFVQATSSCACNGQKTSPTRFLAVIIVCLLPFTTFPIQAAAQQRGKDWTANWITHPTAPLRDPGVYHFRKILELKTRPTRFVVRVSADNRFILFVNGQRVGDGPARSDLHHWHYETFDLAPFLASGRNVIAATVFQFGIYAALAQISDRLAFLLQGDSTAEAILNTDSSWEVEQELGHTPVRAIPEGLWSYYAAGPGERIDGALYDWDWLTGNSTTGRWVKAGPAIRESIYPHGSRPVLASEGGDSVWWIMPDPLPPMEFTEVPSGQVVRSSITSAQTFPNGPVTIPPNTDAALLLDAGVVLSAYPELIVTGGKGSDIHLSYTEALYDSKQLRGNRNEVADRVVLGVRDELIPDGAENRTFMPLWWRTWRYVELRIHTADAAITLVAFHTFYTAYPFTEKGKFVSSDPQLEKIREISWRTARLDAHETYMDTAYWEQLQYIGDTRIQALISYTVSGDDRLARQAMLAFDRSRIPEGITQSRYPGSLLQLIPPFSLLYIDMLHDYWMYRPDVDFLKDRLPGTRPVLAWFEQRQRSDGFLGPLPYWNFVDTPPGVEKFPPVHKEGRSSILTLQFVRALLDAAEMEESLGDPAVAAKYRREAHVAAKAVYAACWNRDLGLLADTPDKNTYSQHANALAVLTDVIPQKDQAQLMQKIFLEIPGMAHASYFFQFYITRALDRAGLGDFYLRTLDPWRHMLEQGLTTTPEYPDPSRSDTHAWSAHPAYDLPTMIAGIRPGSSGFATVRIEPHLGDLEWVDASMPHPAGMIRVSYRRTGKSVNATIDLPPGISGVVAWKGIHYDLHAGTQQLTLP